MASQSGTAVSDDQKQIRSDSSANIDNGSVTGSNMIAFGFELSPQNSVSHRNERMLIINMPWIGSNPNQHKEKTITEWRHVQVIFSTRGFIYEKRDTPNDGIRSI